MVFSEIIGQDVCVNFLRRALKTNKIAHAYLFAGTEGCGKQLTAQGLIAALFCPHHTGCGSCPVCRKVMSGQHPDLHLLAPDGINIKISQIRELQHDLALRPYEAPRKACVIDGAERLNQASGNALLKTLEEPPGSALIILLTTNAESVLPTIRSRCQTLYFKNISEESIVSYLVGEGADLEKARFAAAQSAGSLGKARTYIETASGLDQNGTLRQLVQLNMGSIQSLFTLAETMGSDRDTALQGLSLMEGFFRDVLLAQQNVLTCRSGDRAELVEAEAARRSSASLPDILSEIRETRQVLQRNVNPQLALEVLFMSLAA